VQLARKEPWTPPAVGAVTPQQTPAFAQAETRTEQPGLIQRMRNRVRGWMK
jgi:hypothetical protein